MKAKTIKHILTLKLEDLITSVDDGAVRDIIRKNAIITGGSIVSMLMKEKVNDYDIYFRTKQSALSVARYFLAKAQTASPKWMDRQSYKILETENRIQFVIGVDKPIFTELDVEEIRDDAIDQMEVGDEIAASALENEDKDAPKYQVAFISPNAITLTNQVQLIIRFYGEAEDIHKNYDYVHCTSYWTSWNNELVLRPEALESILTKELRYVGSLYPICSVVRLRKFIARGWVINAGQIMKMAWQISKLDLTDLKVLEDQMVGVDSAYFRMLIAILSKKDSEKVDENYLMTLIDRIF